MSFRRSAGFAAGAWPWIFGVCLASWLFLVPGISILAFFFDLAVDRLVVVAVPVALPGAVLAMLAARARDTVSPLLAQKCYSVYLQALIYLPTVYPHMQTVECIMTDSTDFLPQSRTGMAARVVFSLLLLLALLVVSQTYILLR